MSVLSISRPTGARRTPALFGFAGAAILFTGLMTAGAQAASVDASAKYVISLGGFNFATVGVDFKSSGSDYSVAIGADISGVARLVANGTARANSAGAVRGTELAPNAFSVETKAARARMNVDVEFSGGDTSAFKVEPPVIDTIGRVALERRQLRGVTDPIASFILKGRTLESSLCNRQMKIFSGMERYDISMRFAEMTEATSSRTGYQGPVVLCQITYKPIAGHYENSEMTDYLATSNKMLIWYAPLANSGYFIPYRVLMGTAAGDLSMVLTDLEAQTDVASN